MGEKKKHPFEAEMDAISQRPKGKNELIARLSKILNRVDDATFFRRQENAVVGRDASEDNLLAALDIAKLELLRLGATTTIK